jgi:hypothetical protein
MHGVGRQSSRSRPEQDVGVDDLLSNRGPFISVTHVELDAGPDVVIDDADRVTGHAMTREFREDLAAQ